MSHSLDLHILNPFHRETPKESYFEPHFLVVLIYGGFWEIMGPLIYPVGELGALQGVHKLEFGLNWPNCSILTLLDQFHQ